MNIETNSPELRPPILSEAELTPSGIPPSFGEAKIVVPPILTEEQKKPSQKNPPQKKEKRTIAESLSLLLVWLARKEIVGTWASFVFHFFLLMSLALIVYRVPQLREGLLAGGFSIWEDGIGDGDGWEINLNETQSGDPNLIVPDISSGNDRPENFLTEQVEGQLPSETGASQQNSAVVSWGPGDGSPGDGSPGGDPVKTMGTGGGFAGSRTGANRGKRGGPGDPTNSSEGAVDTGLYWIVTHQNSNGSWSFDLGVCGKNQWCSHPGTHSSRNAATALALLPLLGAGYTHLDGQHRPAVKKGLDFLLDSRNNIELSYGNDLTQQNAQGMYVQGLATLALCEAYGMTQGKAKTKRDQEFEIKLRDAAQGAIRYIEAAQAQQGKFIGGWRYHISDMPGDMSVTGWQMLALKSALLSGLEVKSTTLTQAELFLDSTQYDEGRQFNYLPLKFPNANQIGKGELVGRHPDSVYTCTAIGLLLRMYLGAQPGFQPLDEGMGYLDRWGGLKSDRKAVSSDGHCNLYYAYYGTLAMKHYGGSGWVRWYSELQEFLVQTQAKGGHEKGSWFFSDPYCDVGGRLLNTSFAIMILEAPYRYSSLYE